MQSCSFGSLPAQYRVTLRAIATVDACDFVCRKGILVVVAPGEHDEGGEGADRARGDHPPDMPDQREAHDGGEERADEAGRRIARDLDIPILRHFVGPAMLSGVVLALPISVSAGYLGQHGEIEGRRRRRGGHSSERPSQGSPVLSCSFARWRMLTTSWPH